MSYFPFFLNLKGRKVLLVGGGDIAYRRLNYLLDFELDVDIVSKDFSKKFLDKIKLHGLNFKQKEYEKDDLKGYFLIVVAINDIDVQKEISRDLKDFNCLVNFVDLVDESDFIFSSYIKEGNLLIAISTSASSPSFAKYLKNEIKKIIPHDIEDFLSKMKKLRKTIPKGKGRMEFLKLEVKRYITKF